MHKKQNLCHEQVAHFCAAQAPAVMCFTDSGYFLGRADLIINGNAMAESGGRVERSMAHRNGNMPGAESGAGALCFLKSDDKVFLGAEV